MLLKLSTNLFLITLISGLSFLLPSPLSKSMTAWAFSSPSTMALLKQRANKSPSFVWSGPRSVSPLNNKNSDDTNKEPISPSSSKKETEQEEDDDEGYQVEVSYEGRSTTLHVKPNEPILTAMERSHVSNTLCLPTIPHECRRGNCLTCTGVHAPNSNVSNIVSDEDGLSPHVSKYVSAGSGGDGNNGGGGGYVLTCSSFVVGDGVKLELGRNDDVWTEVYSNRFMGEDMERIGMEARARLLRRVAEQNVSKWTKETEEALRQSGR